MLINHFKPIFPANEIVGQKNGKKMYISVVVPIYKSFETLQELCIRLKQTLIKISSDFEIILVNDGSPDESQLLIEALALQDDRIKGILLSRNFGQHHAISAGLDYAQGDWIVVMDADLQDIPEEIEKLHSHVNAGFDLIVGRRQNRQDAKSKKIMSKIFYKIFGYLTDSNVDDRIGNFGIYSKKVIKNIQRLREQNRSFGLFAYWIGFKRLEIDIEHGERPHGKSSYTLKKMITLALDSITAYSNKLLILTIQFGFAMSLLSLLFVLWLLIKYFFFTIPLAGWTSLLVSLYLVTGLIIASIGVLGLYIGKVFNEVKGRPIYIVESTTFNTEL
jgi:dolichol-phosphate mannosyltransferase